jgi:hypothetical protein
MDHEDILLTLAEVSVALAGFSGVVAVFGRRDPGTWSFADRFRFFALVHTSLSSLLLCILPFGLLAFNIPEEAVWRALSSLLVLYLIVVAVLSTRRLLAAAASERGEFTAIVMPVGLAIGAATLALNIYNVAVGAAFGPFLLGLIFLLVTSSFLFARMLVSAFGVGPA